MSAAIDLSVSSIESPEEFQYETIMLIGTPGAGKTSQIATLPGRKFLYVFDPNCLQTLRGRAHNLDFKAFMPDIRDVSIAAQTLAKDHKKDSSTVKKRESTTYVEWEKDFESRCENGFFKDYDWIILDSFTTFSEIVMDRVQELANRAGKHPEQADWTAQMNIIKSIFRVLTGLGLNIACTAHTELKRDELAGRTYAQPVMTGRLRIRIPMLFSNMFSMSNERDDKSGNTKYYCTTQPSREHPLARTNIMDLPATVDVTVDWKKSAEGQGIGGLLLKANKLKLKSTSK